MTIQAPISFSKVFLRNFRHFASTQGRLGRTNSRLIIINLKSEPTCDQVDTANLPCIFLHTPLEM